VHGGHLDIRFFPRKISEVEPIRVHFGPLIEGNIAHILLGVSITDSVFSVSLKCIGSGRESRFLAPNFSSDKRPGVYFGPLLGGTRAHILLFF